MGKLLSAIQFAALIIFGLLAVSLLFFSLPFTGWKALNVQTGSMEPNIPKGSLVFVHSVPPSSLKVGDVVTYKSLESPVTITHRIIKIVDQKGAYKFIVKGDANKTADQPVFSFQVVGVVSYAIPGLGSAVNNIRTPLGLSLFVYIPAFVLAAYEIWLLVRRISKLELEKFKTTLKPLTQPTTQAITSKPIATKTGDNKTPVVKKHPRTIDGIMTLLLVAATLFTTARTLALQQTTAKLTNNTISSATTVSGNCSKLTMLDIAFDNNDDEDDEVWVTLCAPVCPVDSSLWTLTNLDEGDSWTKDALIIKCVTNMPKNFKGPKSGDLMALTDGKGHTIDELRYPDSKNNHHKPSHHDGHHADDHKRQF